MLYGLQAVFNEPIGADLLEALRARGVQLIRADVQGVMDRAALEAIIDEIQAAQLRPLLIITPGQVPWLPADVPLDVELLNEPDLEGYTPDGYAGVVRDVAREIGGVHRLWAGSVSNCTREKLRWLGRVLAQIPADISVTVHRYPKNGGRPSDGQEGFRSRREELAAVQRTVGGRAWGCSEFGYHTGEQKTGHWFWTKRWHWTDAQVAAFAAMEWQYWQQAGAAFSTWYQLNDGVGDDPIDRFGIRRTDGTWKPVAETFGGA